MHKTNIPRAEDKNTMREKILSEIADIISVFTDLDGGLWSLTILCELLSEMCNTQNWQAAEIIRRKMYQAAEVTYKDEKVDAEELLQFVEIITEEVEDIL